MTIRESFDPVFTIHRDTRKAPRKSRLSELDCVHRHEIEDHEQGMEINDFLARSPDWGYSFTHQRWERWKEAPVIFGMEAYHDPARKSG